MAHTEIFLSNDAGTLLASQPSVPVANGDTVAFSITGGGPAFLFFSPAAIAALSPAPPVPLALSEQGPTLFTFTTSDAGAYSVFFETDASAPVPDFPPAPSNLLLMELDTSGVGFGGPTNNAKRGG